MLNESKILPEAYMIDAAQLSSSLVANKVVDQDGLGKAETYAAENKTSVRDALVKLQLATDESIGQVEAAILNVPFVVLTKLTIPAEVLNILPHRVAEKLKAIVFERTNEGIKIALSDPADTSLAQNLVKKTGQTVFVFYATPLDIQSMITIPTKKLLNGFEMPVFGLGTWMMGGDKLRNPDNNDKADVTAIQNAIQAGITHIDTAEGYAEGHAETLVGEAIKGYEREKLFIVSKAKKENHAYDDLLRSAEASLERLGTEYLDLYLLHAPSQVIPIEETMSAMDYLVKKGLVKYIGVSNFTVSQMKKAQEVSQNKIVANQLHLNLIYRETEKAELLGYCQQNDVMFIAWRPLQKGILLEAGKEILDSFAKKYDKTPAQIALNWLISQKNVVTLSKISDKDHLQENLGAIGWEMSQEDIIFLAKNFPNQQFVSDAVPLKEWA